MAPLVGYNDNIRYGGNTYHVQTEDSGPRRPHVITHLFADGGRIVTSKKTSYEEHVGADDIDERVRALMRGQHKAMLGALQNGELDELLDDSSAAAQISQRPKPPAAVPRPPRPTPSADDGSGDDAEPLPLTAAVPVERGEGPSSPTSAPGGDDGEVDEEREAVRTKIGRRKPSTEPEVLPPVGSSVPVEELEQAARVAERGFQEGIQPRDDDPERDEAERRRSRKPTPITGAGAYRYVAPEGGTGQEKLSKDDGEETGAPPHKRRYPQTNPGRKKAADQARRSPAPTVPRPRRGRRPVFGERFLTNRTLDRIILEVLSRETSS